MSFCDFCDCNECQFGYDAKKKIHHAKTSDGKLICEICYEYDLCTANVPNRRSNPCINKNCTHRPIIVSEWSLI